MTGIRDSRALHLAWSTHPLQCATRSAHRVPLKFVNTAPVRIDGDAQIREHVTLRLANITGPPIGPPFASLVDRVRAVLLGPHVLTGCGGFSMP